MSDHTKDSRAWSVPRRAVLAAALGYGGARTLLADEVVAPTHTLSGRVARVAADGSGDFGPQTPGTRTCGIQEATDAVRARSAVRRPASRCVETTSR